MASTPFVQGSQAAVLAAGIFPTQSEQVSQATVSAITDHKGGRVEAAQAAVLVAARGRVANPRVRAWSFTLDGHDFYVLKLGDQATLVYDVYSDQWIDWSSGKLPFWRVLTGATWIGGAQLGYIYGSSIVCGDDTKGLLWILDPERPFDDDPRSGSNQAIPFTRVVMGQAPIPIGRDVAPCYAIFLQGDSYGLVADDFTPLVNLEYSDDAGRNYESAGSLTVDQIESNRAYAWYSLGQIEAPGRLFRIVDNGVFSRIDAMTMNEAEGSDDG